MNQPEPTGDLTKDLGHAVAYFPVFLVQWVLGLILVILSDYAIFTFLVTAVAVAFASSWIVGLATFLALYSIFRIVTEHGVAVNTGLQVVGRSVLHRNITHDE